MKNLYITMEIPKNLFLKAQKEAEEKQQIMKGIKLNEIKGSDFIAICENFSYMDIQNFIISNFKL